MVSAVQQNPATASPSPLPLQAASIGSLWQARRLANAWTAHHPTLHPFASTGIHRSVNPVYPLGTPIYYRVTEFQRLFGQFIDSKLPDLQSPSDYSKSLVLKQKPPSRPEPSSVKKLVAALPETCKEARVFSRDDLYDLLSVLRRLSSSEESSLVIGFTIADLEALCARPASWQDRRQVLTILDSLVEKPEVARWLRNTEGHLCINALSAVRLVSATTDLLSDHPDVATVATVQTFLSDLIRRRADSQGLDPNYSAVFKYGTESYYEFLPAAVATALKIDSMLVPTGMVGFPYSDLTVPIKRTGSYQFIPCPVGAIQPFIRDGVKPSKHVIGKDNRHLDSTITDAIPLDEYQENSLFIVMTKQCDLHSNNGYFLTDDAGGVHIRLFDIGRSMLPDGLVHRQGGRKIALRSFLMGCSQFDEPLTETMVAKIKAWDPEVLRKTFAVNPQGMAEATSYAQQLQLHLQSSTDELYGFWPTRDQVAGERQAERKLQQHLKRTLSAEQLDELIKRVEAVQGLIKAREQQESSARPTMREIYEATLPREMEFMKLYVTVYGPYSGPVRTSKTTIEKAIQDGVTQGKLTQADADHWHARLKELVDDPNVRRLTSWIPRPTA